MNVGWAVCVNSGSFFSGVFRGYPLHLLTLLLMIAAGLASRSFHIRPDHPEQYEPAAIGPNLLMVHSLPFVTNLSFNAPSWSISAEMICYLAFRFILLASRRRGWIPAVFGLLLMLTLTLTNGGWDGESGLIVLDASEHLSRFP